MTITVSYHLKLKKNYSNQNSHKNCSEQYQAVFPNKQSIHTHSFVEALLT